MNDRELFRFFFEIVEEHVIIDVSWFGLGELREDVMEIVVGLSENEEVLLDDVLAELVLRKHAQDSIDQDPFWVSLDDVLEGVLFKASRVAGMVPVQLLLALAACKQWVIHVNYDALVTLMVLPVDVAWKVLASDVLGDQHSHATHRHALGVEEVVSLPIVIHCNIATLAILLWHNAVHESVLQMIWHRGQAMPDVFVKRNAHHVFFDLILWERLAIYFFASIRFNLVLLFLSQH